MNTDKRERIGGIIAAIIVLPIIGAIVWHYPLGVLKVLALPFVLALGFAAIGGIFTALGIIKPDDWK